MATKQSTLHWPEPQSWCLWRWDANMKLEKNTYFDRCIIFVQLSLSLQNHSNLIFGNWAGGVIQLESIEIWNPPRSVCMVKMTAHHPHPSSTMGIPWGSHGTSCLVAPRILWRHGLSSSQWKVPRPPNSLPSWLRLVDWRVGWEGLGGKPYGIPNSPKSDFVICCKYHVLYQKLKKWTYHKQAEKIRRG